MYSPTTSCLGMISGSCQQPGFAGSAPNGWWIAMCLMQRNPGVQEKDDLLKKPATCSAPDSTILFYQLAFKRKTGTCCTGHAFWNYIGEKNTGRKAASPNSVIPCHGFTRTSIVPVCGFAKLKRCTERLYAVPAGTLHRDIRRRRNQVKDSWCCKKKLQRRIISFSINPNPKSMFIHTLPLDSIKDSTD